MNWIWLIIILLFATVHSHRGHEGGGGSEYCLGGPDPTCYFPDPEENDLFSDLSVRERRDEGDEASQSSTEESSSMVNEEDLVDVERSQTEKDLPLPPLKGDDDDEVLAANLQIEPMANQKDMSELYLKHYEPDTVIESFYPPFTYSGFYSPKDWDKIPAHYFSPKSTGRATNMSKLLEDVQEKHESGKSFMEFGENGTMSNCSTDFPSPINIIKENAREEPTFVKFNVMHFEQLYGFIIFLPEDGTDLLFVKLQTPLKQISKKPSIDKGSVIGSPLTLDRILIHYGVDPNKGSEHRINGKSFGMEIQFMFTLQTQGKELTYYDVLYEYAVSKDSSLFGKNQLCICILVEVAPANEQPKGRVYNKGMRYLGLAAREFGAIRNSRKFRAFQVKKKVLSLQDFFAIPFEGHYYTYFGSLTHPPCFNNTRYSVFETPIRITHDTWRDFLFLPSEYSDSGFVADNFRPLESILVWNNYSSRENPEIVNYMNPEMIEKVSYTVAKSRFATFEDIKGEYDYFDDPLKSKAPSFLTSQALLLMSLLPYFWQLFS